MGNSLSYSESEPVFMSDIDTKPNTEKIKEFFQDLYSTTAIRGHRDYMEDTFIFKKLSEFVFLFGIFDGHGGDQVSLVLKQQFVNTLTSRVEWSNFEKSENILMLQQALESTFEYMDDEYFKHSITVGSTAIICILTENYIICANLGDCRAMIINQKTFFDISTDHKPTYDKERIYNAGGFIEEKNIDDVERVNGCLAISRAFGDREYKIGGSCWKTHKITANPEFTIIQKIEYQKYIIMACDGIWDVFNSFEIYELISVFEYKFNQGFYPFIFYITEREYSNLSSEKYKRIHPPLTNITDRMFIETIAKREDSDNMLELMTDFIVFMALKAGSSDNCTVTIIKL